MPDEPPSWRAALDLAVLTAFAVAQPLLDLVGRHPQMLVVHNAERLEIVALAALLAIGLPAVAGLAYEVLRRWLPRLAAVLHPVAVTCLVAGIVLPPLKRLEAPAAALVSLALAVGVAVTVLYRRWTAMRLFLGVLVPAPLVFLGLFLFVSPASDLMQAGPPVAAAIEVPPPRQPVPVVMVVFDELALVSLLGPDGGIDGQSYPRFAELASRSTWFANASTTAEMTIFALPALLTGRFVQAGERVTTYQSYPENLFTLLAGSHRLEVIETVSELCPRQLRRSSPLDSSTIDRTIAIGRDLAVLLQHRVLPGELTGHLPELTGRWAHFFDGRRQQRQAFREADIKPAAFAAFLDALTAPPEEDSRPGLHFVHSGLPHVPYQYLPTGQRYGDLTSGLLFVQGLEHETWTGHRFDVRQGYLRYLLQLAYVDTLVGELIDRLDETGLWDRALIIVTADHGVSFRHGVSRRRVAPATRVDIVPVPLFVKLPGQTGGEVSSRNVELVDVLPTVADVLGLEVPWEVDGDSVVAGGPARGEKRLYKPPYEPASYHALPATLEPLFADAVARRQRIFGAGTDPLDLFRGAGPRPHLVGCEVADVPRGEPAGEFVLWKPWLFEDVDPAGEFVPARIIGELRGEAIAAAERVPVAVAVDGRVVATAISHRSRRDLDRILFAAIVPPWTFRAGANEVEAYLIEGRGVDLRLRPLEPVQRSWLRRRLGQLRDSLR